MTGDFDPILHIRQVRTHPENYVRMDNLIKQMAATAPLRSAQSLEELRKRFNEATRSAKGDAELLGYLTEVKERRKSELTKV